MIDCNVDTATYMRKRAHKNNNNNRARISQQVTDAPDRQPHQRDSPSSHQLLDKVIDMVTKVHTEFFIKTLFTYGIVYLLSRLRGVKIDNQQEKDDVWIELSPPGAKRWVVVDVSCERFKVS